MNILYEKLIDLQKGPNGFNLTLIKYLGKLLQQNAHLLTLLCSIYFDLAKIE
jgi:hypothetical protein